MSRNVTIGAVLVVVVLILGWWFLTKSQPAPSSSQSNQPSQASPAASESSQAAQMTDQKNLVTISSSGFSPKELVVKVGTVVTWENQDSANHTVNSDVHPTHQLYPPLNSVGLIKPGQKKGFLFDKIGKYTYHDHLNPTLTGSVTVE